MTIHSGLVGYWCGKNEPGDTFAGWDEETGRFTGQGGPPDCAGCKAEKDKRWKESEDAFAAIDAQFEKARARE